MPRRLPFAPLVVGLVLATAPARAQDVSFPASDGETVHATWYPTDDPSAVVLAFHQGGASGRAEYAPIAERLNDAGYTVLAVDQRAGGARFGGINRTVEARGGETGYCEAAPDLEGALRYTREKSGHTPIVLWGSSYSAALVLRLAATRPEGVAAALAFSPASGGPMAECRGEGVSGEIEVPVLVLRPRGEMARDSAIRQFERFRAQGHRTFVAEPGTHGSSMLVEERVGAPVEATWGEVLAFLERAMQ